MRKLFVLIFFCVAYVSLCAQDYDTISGVKNEYYKVTGVYADSVTLLDTTDLITLAPGDKVVLMQMTGVDVGPIDIYDSHDDPPSGYDNTGHYELLSVKAVDDGTHRVSFTVTLDPSRYSSVEKIQLIKIYEADYATVDGDPVVAQPWDGETGGVIAMVIFKKLVLNANIDASAQGFRGGKPESNYTNGCHPDGGEIYYFNESILNEAGGKGEGNIRADYNYAKGPGRVMTGGGGGLGYFSGGGGGGNFGFGGYGAGQKQGCAGYESFNTNGGYGLEGNLFYSNLEDNETVTMGGGGGSTTENWPSSTTPGGNGGGIIIIMGESIQGNNYSIISNGESITETVLAGGAGGGAGGTILMDVNNYEGDLNISVAGGKGGDTGIDSTGAGGGGGGGIFWYAGAERFPSSFVDTSRGVRGYSVDDGHWGGYGSEGGTMTNLKFPLNGFLFNSLNGTDTICAGQHPDTIFASMPKGGETGYTYKWFQSTDGSSWSAALGDEDSLFFHPFELSDTTYFTRVVESGSVSDTAIMVEILVYNTISGNNLDIVDTLCNNDSPGVFSIAGPLSGGDGSYDYDWESSVNTTNWENRGSASSLSEVELQTTSYYRRIVYSGNRVCIDTSNIERLEILPAISGNIFAPADTAICSDSDAGTLQIDQPDGGDGNYSYQWLESNDDLTYSPIIGSNSQNFSPGILNNTVYYKREVKSGANDVCNDLSNRFELVVYPSIEFNQIEGEAIQYTCFNTPIELSGDNNLGGGSGEGFNYLWQESLDGAGFSDASGLNSAATYGSSQLTDTIYFWRIVKSGTYDQCIDTSDAVLIRLHPLPSGDIISKPDTSCSEGTISIGYENLQGSGSMTFALGINEATYDTTLTSGNGEVRFPADESGAVRVQSIIDANECEANLTANTGVIDLVVYTYPNAFAGDVAEVCGQSVTMGATLNGETGLWTGTGGEFSDASSPTTELTIDAFSDSIVNSYIWTVANWQCEDDDSLTIVFYQQPEIPDLGEDVSLVNAYTYSLNAPAPLGNGLWDQISAPPEGDAEFEDSTLYNSFMTFSTFITGEYILEWTDENGVCPAVSDQIIISIDIPKLSNAFTPNDDGINDDFTIPLSGLKGDAVLIILDRSGNLVRRLTNENNWEEIRWDGTKDNMGGSKMPEGTYYYILSGDGKKNPVKDFIELRR